MKEELSQRLEKLSDAALEAAVDGVASESISTPNGGSRSLTHFSPEQISAAKKAILADAGADLLVRRHRGSAFCVSYPTFM